MAETTIGPRTRIDGLVTGSDVLVVEGEIKGTVTMDAPIRIQREGRLEAEVQGPEVAIAGTVQGHVIGTRKVEILSGAKMIGDVRTPRILISDGAVFRGRVDMDLGEG